MELIGFHPHAVRIGAEFAGIDAEHDVLSVGIFLIDVMSIACGDQRQAHLLGNFDGAFHLSALHLEAIVLDLNEIALAEKTVKPGGDFFRLGQQFAARILAFEQRRLNSLETQPLKQIMPSWNSSSRARSMRGLK